MKKTNKCVNISPDSAFQWVISIALLYTGMMIWKRHAVALIVARKSWREEFTTFLNKTTIQDGIHSTWAWEVKETAVLSFMFCLFECLCCWVHSQANKWRLEGSICRLTFNLFPFIMRYHRICIDWMNGMFTKLY